MYLEIKKDLRWRWFSIRLAFNDERFVIFVRSGLDLKEQFVGGRLLHYPRRFLNWKKANKVKIPKLKIKSPEAEPAQT